MKILSVIYLLLLMSPLLAADLKDRDNDRLLEEIRTLIDIAIEPNMFDKLAKSSAIKECFFVESVHANPNSVIKEKFVDGKHQLRALCCAQESQLQGVKTETAVTIRDLIGFEKKFNEHLLFYAFNGEDIDQVIASGFSTDGPFDCFFSDSIGSAQKYIDKEGDTYVCLVAVCLGNCVVTSESLVDLKAQVCETKNSVDSICHDDKERKVFVVRNAQQAMPVIFVKIKNFISGWEQKYNAEQLEVVQIYNWFRGVISEDSARKLKYQRIDRESLFLCEHQDFLDINIPEHELGNLKDGIERLRLDKDSLPCFRADLKEYQRALVEIYRKTRRIK